MDKNKKNIIIKLIEVISLLLVSTYSCLNIYFINIIEAHFADIFPIMFILIFISIILMIIFYIIFKDISCAVFYINLVLFFLLNYKFIEDLLRHIYSNIFYWHVCIIIFFILINIALFLYEHKIKELSKLNMIIAVIFSFMVLIDFIQAVSVLIDNKSINSNYSNIFHAQSPKVEQPKVKPNVYYLIFDEYGGPENLQYFMNFNNKEFYNELENNKVNVSYNSRNIDIKTYKIVADLVSLHKVSYDKMSIEESAKIRANPLLISIFREHGYKINKITNDPIGKDAQPEYSTSNKNIKFENINEIILQNTILYPINNSFYIEYTNSLDAYIAYLFKSIDISEDGILHIGHFNLPHLPFIYDKNGNKNPVSLYYDVINNDVYLNQLEYTNKIIIKFINEVIEKNPNAIVLIQSDHGCRNLEHRRFYLKERTPTQEEYEYMKSILNILYYQGKEVNINGLSGYETLNLVVENLFNIKIADRIKHEKN